MLPTREEAERILAEAGKCNPGPCVNHSCVMQLQERMAFWISQNGWQMYDADMAVIPLKSGIKIFC